jgi:hypothetical protein
MKTLIAALTLFTTLQSYASPRAFQIYRTKQVPPPPLPSHVVRFEGQDGNAFATVFCKEEENIAQVMMVDSRIPELDGKVFMFSSVQACLKAQHISGRCPPLLIIDQEDNSARTEVRCN